MSWQEMVLQRHENGTVSLVGEAPQRMRVARELLDEADSAFVTLNDSGDIMLTLTNAVLWYRRVGPVDGDPRQIEFERVG
ncbi:hypothetical protein HH310_12520 [Actinoplanes sp. TBRC 11911]|uniref:hypothetical protein n=1 Tax=Actinoplanes sp. TBRC 11911 TaxID=2729386 RepID=UPI00145C658B|nr:hypothetical protein [Actinoplanes sp. TBRC 11911]NMO52017.1 hypothetical protein [Actinoplanes sp. TBRC 11911]